MITYIFMLIGDRPVTSFSERMLCKPNYNLDLQSVKGYTPADAWARKA